MNDSKNNSEKKQYQKIKLVKYGQAAELTLGGNNAGSWDGFMWWRNSTCMSS